MRLGTLGQPSRPTEPADMRELREARVAAARRNPYWTELRQAELVRRPPGYLVDSESDRVFTPYQGPIFTHGQTRPSFQESVRLAFYIDQNGGLQFLEPVPGAATWSQVVERQARRSRR